MGRQCPKHKTHHFCENKQVNQLGQNRSDEGLAQSALTLSVAQILLEGWSLRQFLNDEVMGKSVSDLDDGSDERMVSEVECLYPAINAWMGSGYLMYGHGESSLVTESVKLSGGVGYRIY